METFKTFQKTLRRLGEEKFLSRNPHPFLVSSLELIKAKEEKISDQVKRGFETTITGRDLIEKELETAWAEPGWVISLWPRKGEPLKNLRIEVTVGKGKKMDIIIPLPSISNHHGTFIISENHPVLYRDNHSDRGSFLNETLLSPEKETPLKKGDSLGLGKFLIFQVYSPQDLFEVLSELEGV